MDFSSSIFCSLCFNYDSAFFIGSIIIYLLLGKPKGTGLVMSITLFLLYVNKIKYMSPNVLAVMAKKKKKSTGRNVTCNEYCVKHFIEYKYDVV